MATIPNQENNGVILHPDRVARNTSYFTIALIIQKVLSLGYFIYISRAVGNENIGTYLTALAITTVFGIFIDIGFSQVLIREVAKHQEHTHRYLNTTLALKSLTAIVAYGAAIAYVHVFPYPEIVRSLVTLTGVVMALDSFTLTFYAVFRGHQKLQYESIGTVINKLVVMGIGILGLSMGFGIRMLVMAILVGSAFNFFYASTLLVRKLGWRPRPRLERSSLGFLGKIAIPFAIAGIFTTVYGYLDQVLLGNPALVGDNGPSYVGWYGTAYKLTFALQFVPAAVAAAIFPAMSAYYVTSKELLARTFERAMFYLLVISMPLSFGILALADKMILLAYGEAFRASIAPLQILIGSLLFVFLNYPVGYLLNAADRQTRNTIHIGAVMVLNLILNILLIPRFTFVGAAIASTVSSAVLFSLGFLVVGKIIQYDRRYLITTFGKTLLASGSMAIGLLFFKDLVHIIFLMPLAAAWYFGTLFLIRGFRLADAMRIVNAVRRKA